MEGSSLGRLDDDENFPTEKEIEQLFVERMRRRAFIAVVAGAAATWPLAMSA